MAIHKMSLHSSWGITHFTLLWRSSYYLQLGFFPTDSTYPQELYDYYLHLGLFLSHFTHPQRYCYHFHLMTVFPCDVYYMLIERNPQTPLL